MSTFQSFLPPFIYQNLVEFKRGFLDKNSTGLNELDLRLIEAIDPKEGGYFVELGANDGIRQSNTYKLQKDYAWNGLLIEPSPLRFAECVKNRSFGTSQIHFECAACVSFGFGSRFVEIEEADLMSVAKGLDVSDEDAVDHANRGVKSLSSEHLRYRYGAVAEPLNELLIRQQSPRRISLLSLDVEGNELSVLKGIDYDTFRFDWILCECRNDSIKQELTKHGYSVFKVLSSNSSYQDTLFAPVAKR
jgi:FkbM family methyltransferase